MILYRMLSSSLLRLQVDENIYFVFAKELNENKEAKHKRLELAL
jgi:hypothetical protein